MLFPSPLVTGRLVRRYKRFLSDVILDDGTEVVAHIANSGAMTGLDAPGSPVWLSRATNPARKLAWTWELVRADGGLVGVNTQHPNLLVAEAVAAGTIPQLAGYASLRREVPYGVSSRIDLLLAGPGRPTCFVEVKNVHLRRGAGAAFPDAPTARGTKHLRELTAMVAAGARAVMLYLVQRMDCEHFSLAADIDPAYAAAMTMARAGGVETLCHGCTITPAGIIVDRALPIRV